MTHVDTAKEHNLKPVNNVNSCNSFKSICLSKATLLQLNESKNYKLSFVTCFNKSQTIFMFAKCSEYKLDNASIYFVIGRDYSSVSVWMLNELKHNKLCVNMQCTKS